MSGLPSNWHGPGHLFCAGCTYDDVALAWAAWAGMAMARNDRAEAERCSAEAVRRNGKRLSSMGEIEVRFFGDRARPTADEIDMVIRMLEITRESFRRCEAHDAAKAAPPVAPPSPDAELHARAEGLKAGGGDHAH